MKNRIKRFLAGFLAILLVFQIIYTDGKIISFAEEVQDEYTFLVTDELDNNEGEKE